MSWSQWFLGAVLLLTFVGACVAVAYLVMRAWAPRERRAIDILRERYARGEIDQREFEERRRILQV